MNIYISGISGTGMGPLALIAKGAGYTVYGSDLTKGAIYDELISAGVDVHIGPQDGKYFQERLSSIDWFVYTSALPDDHPELMAARNAGIKCTKRDDFTAHLVDKLNLKMVAVAGTHGKTTTTAMIVWAALQLELPVSYIVGSTLGFAPSGAYHEGDRYFIYEADEYDRNFLKYHPWLAVIPSISYDHPDIYPTREDYQAAFEQFMSQSEKVVTPPAQGVSSAHKLANSPDEGFFATTGANDRELAHNDGPSDRCPSGTIRQLAISSAARPAQGFQVSDFKLPGDKRRIDAALAAQAISEIAESEGTKVSPETIINTLNQFPGVGRRFEKLQDGLYTDYAHHPEEIAATVEIAREEAELTGRKGVVVLYQPHQNVRQHEVHKAYKSAFIGADKILWLPTYLVREDPSLPVLTPEQLISGLDNAELAEPVELGEALAAQLRQYLQDGYLVILMTAGPADDWLRQHFTGQAATI